MITTLLESILVGPNALQFMLRAFGSMRMCHADVTGGTLVAARVVPKPIVTDTGLFMKILQAWASCASRAETETYLKGQFLGDSTIAVRVLEGCLPYGTNMKSGLRSKADFRRMEYDTLSKVIDPILVHAALGDVLRSRNVLTGPRPGNDASPRSGSSSSLIVFIST